MQLTDSEAVAKTKYWAKILGIDPIYEIGVKVNNAPDPNLKKHLRKDTQAFVKVDQSYFFINVTYNAYEIDRSELDSVVVHELIHVLLAPLDRVCSDALGKRQRQHAIDIVESATERLAKAFMRLKGSK
jgi:hypothetical protein